MYMMHCNGAMRRVVRKPIDTAGLKCAPLTPAKMLTATDSAKPCASAKPKRPAPLLIGSDVATIAPMPAKHRKNVPSASASNCLNEYIDRYLPGLGVEYRVSGAGHQTFEWKAFPS